MTSSDPRAIAGEANLRPFPKVSRASYRPSNPIQDRRQISNGGLSWQENDSRIALRRKDAVVQEVGIMGENDAILSPRIREEVLIRVPFKGARQKTGPAELPAESVR